jgi:long-chain acyl-CoA synthetase
MYTGGTTGISKGAMLTNKNIVSNALQVRAWLPKIQVANERILSVIPFFHSYGMTTCLNLAIVSAATMVLLPQFIIKDVLGAINRYRPTMFPGVPTMYIALINNPEIGKYDLRSISACISGAAALPVEVQAKFEQITGGRLVEGYGLSEASPVTHANPIYGLRKAGSIGLPFPSTVAKVVSLETGEDLSVGEIGELVVQGPQVMQGYWNNEEETQLVLKGNWLYTGDLAKMDEDGYFFIVDRKKDMIIAGGYNIYPRDIEEVLYTHPKIQEALVISAPHEYLGEAVKAFVVLKPGEEASAEEIIQYCSTRLAKFKVPKMVEFRGSLPKTLIGKILRRVVVDEERKKYLDKVN